MAPTDVADIDDEKFEHFVEREYEFEAPPGINEEVVRTISEEKNEPEWMLERRLRALKIFQSKPMPEWGADLSDLNFDDIVFYRRLDPTKNETDWEDVPEDIKDTFDRLGIPEAEQKALSGASGQFDSEQVYANMEEEWEEKGVIFCDMDQAVQQHPEIVKEYFMNKCVPPSDNKFAALHGAVWAGGTFMYVPEGVEIEMPMQAYFRMNAQDQGQFEHTLIIAEENSNVHYIEGCSAPSFTSSSLHAGCVEVFAKDGASVQYSTVQNWSKNTYNLNTKRAIVGADAEMRWLSGSMGSKVTMLYPSSVLRGRGGKTTNIALAFANSGQHLDTGSKAIHVAPDTKSTIQMKSISKGTGHTVYRGLVKVLDGAKNSSVNVVCDAMMLDKESSSDTIPNMEINENKVEVGHEATAGRISEEDLFYLMSRGMEQEEALAMIVKGFIDPVTKELPMEYSVELNRLIQMELEESDEVVDEEGYLEEWAS
jgi:Fe-S cluster assembly protein SufB